MKSHEFFSQPNNFPKEYIFIRITFDRINTMERVRKANRVRQTIDNNIIQRTQLVQYFRVAENV